MYSFGDWVCEMTFEMEKLRPPGLTGIRGRSICIAFAHFSVLPVTEGLWRAGMTFSTLASLEFLSLSEGASPMVCMESVGGVGQRPGQVDAGLAGIPPFREVEGGGKSMQRISVKIRFWRVVSSKLAE